MNNVKVNVNLIVNKLMRQSVKFKFNNEEYLIVEDNKADSLRTVNLTRSYISSGDLNEWVEQYKKGLIEIISSPKPELQPAMKLRLILTGHEYIVVKSGNDLKLLSFPECVMQINTTEIIQAMYDNGDLVIIEE
jgi:hypothetical protein